MRKYKKKEECLSDWQIAASKQWQKKILMVGRKMGEFLINSY